MSNTSAGNDDWLSMLSQQVVDDGQHVPDPTAAQLHQAVPVSHAIEGNRYDDYLFLEALETIDSFATVIEEAREDYPLTDELAGDVIRSLYHIDPKEQSVDPAYQRNADAIHEMLSTTDYKQLHELTQLDGFASGLAASTLTEALVKTLTEQQEAPPTPPGLQEEGEEQRRMQLRVAARKAIQQAGKALAEAQEAIKAFGGGEDEVGGGWGTESGKARLQGDIRARAQLARAILQNETLRRIAQLAGRMKRIAAQVERSRLTLGNQELYGVVLGNDIRNALPTELALLTRPALKRLFYARYAERSLTQYERYTPEPTGRGPIVISLDESGSMNGRANEWAKAVVLALLSIAARQRRDLRVLHYASASNLLVEDYHLGHGTPEQVMQTALHFFSGGTDYEPWMRAALAAIAGSDYDRADVVAISDGECAVGDELLAQWRTTKATRGFRCISILIGAARGGEVMRQFSDEVHHLTTLRDDQATLEQLFTLAV